MSRFSSKAREAAASVALGLEPFFPSSDVTDPFGTENVELVMPLHGHARSERQDWPEDERKRLPVLNRKIRRELGVSSVAEALRSAGGSYTGLEMAVSAALDRIDARAQISGRFIDDRTLTYIPK